MTTFFPKHTVQWHFEEPTAIRRFSLSVWEMAVLTGIALRLYYAIVVPRGPTNWVWFGGSLALGILLLVAMSTAHLANYPLHRWAWRAPLFALVEVAAESVTSLVLIALGREPSGTARAEWSDWLPIAWDTLWKRELTVCLWALLLAAVIFIVRKTILRETKVEEEATDIAQA